MTLLRLRCIRCGDLDDMDPRWGWALCAWCFEHRPTIRPVYKYKRWLRWQRNMGSHPTYKALTAALDALEAVPHGSLDSGGA